jgi:hypothetical protein
MKKHLDPDIMEKELRLTFPPPLEVRIDYLDSKNFLKFLVLGVKGEPLYESPKLPMQGQANVRIPRHFAFHLTNAKQAVYEKAKNATSIKFE